MGVFQGRDEAQVVARAIETGTRQLNVENFRQPVDDSVRPLHFAVRFVRNESQGIGDPEVISRIARLEQKICG